MIDPLSEVLRSVRLIGGVFLEARFTAPWCVSSQIAAEDCRPFLAVPAQIIAYHFIIEGRLLVQLDADPPFEISAGEIVLLPRNNGHTLASASGLNPINAHDLIQPAADGGLVQISHGGGGKATHLVCGFLGSEEVYNPLLATLPRVLTLDVRQGTSRNWVEASVRFAARELAEGRFASSSVMSRLSELLFVEAVRNYASTLSEEEPGGSRDYRIQTSVGRLPFCTAELIRLGQPRCSRAKWRFRAAPSTTASLPSSACRRSDISPSGACRWPRRGFAKAVARLRRSRMRSATSRRLLSIAPSSANLAILQPDGGRCRVLPELALDEQVVSEGCLGSTARMRMSCRHVRFTPGS